MRNARIGWWVVGLVALAAMPSRGAPASPALAGARSARFEANVGQFGVGARFVARTSGAALVLFDDGATLVAGDRAISLAVASGRRVAPEPEHRLATKTSYFRGRDPSGWRTDVPTYAGVRYPDVLAGVDLVFHGDERQLEYDFVISPGADPAAIALEARGADVALTPDGALDLGGGIVQPRPRVYQRTADGHEQTVAAGYRILDGGRIGFELAAYDRARPLVIDPILTYTKDYSGAGNVTASSLVAGADGSVIVAGDVTLDGIPTTAGSAQPSSHGNGEGFVMKLDPSGEVAWATYLGGSDSDTAHALAVDASGNVLVAGQTLSSNFPVTNGAAQSVFGGAPYADGFVAKLGPTGALVWSTYLGGAGSDVLEWIAVDADGAALVAGSTTSTSLPGARNAHVGEDDAFVAKLGPTGTLAWSTYFGGTLVETPVALTLDASGRAYLAGYTQSGDLPVTPGAAVGAFQGTHDHDMGFALRLRTDGALDYATYLGGSAENAPVAIAVDPNGDLYVGGYTQSQDFPTTAGAPQAKQAGPVGTTDAFVTKLNGTGGLAYATLFGGAANENIAGFAIDSSGAIVFGGSTSSPTLPVTAGAAQPSFGGGDYDAYAAKLAPDGTLAWATYFGASAFEDVRDLAIEPNGAVVLIGTTTSTDLPTTAKSLQPAYGGGAADVYVTKLDADGALRYTTYSGGVWADRPAGVAIDSRGSIDVLESLDRSSGGSRPLELVVLQLAQPQPSLSPSGDQHVAPRDTLVFTASGASAPYTFTLTENGSGATLAPGASTVTYTAGPDASTVDVVAVTDDWGETASVTVHVDAPDAGPESDASAADASTPPLEPPTSETSTNAIKCSCDLVGAPIASSPGFVVALGLVLLALRRKRTSG